MNVEIGIKAAQFPEKKYINEIFVAMRLPTPPPPNPSTSYSKYNL